jgi:hypothetical protein
MYYPLCITCNCNHLKKQKKAEFYWAVLGCFGLFELDERDILLSSCCTERPLKALKGPQKAEKSGKKRSVYSA